MKKVLWKLWRIYAHTVGIIFLIMFVYIVIKLSIIYHPVDINSDKVTKIEIVYTDHNEKKRYTVEITEQTVINELVKKTNDFKVTEGTTSGGSDYSMTIYFRYDNEYYSWVRLWGNAIILGEESFKLRKKDKKDYIEYIKYLIEESDICIVEDW